MNSKEEYVLSTEGVSPRDLAAEMKRIASDGKEPFKVCLKPQDVRFGYTPLNAFQRFCKRFSDIFLSVLALVTLSPLMLFSAVMVKCSSKGSVFYSQSRIGQGGKPFRIFKFRSMYVGAEPDGPCLSSKGDTRITPWGGIMRKYRIDELPQFWNVIKGEMSIVGYRPERDFYIERIVEHAPYYTLLYALKPGITSRGITLKGYAETVEQMVVRLQDDMDYLQRVSLKEDLRVMAMTVKVVLWGRGK